MAEMRKLVGHKTIIQCAASIICVDEDGRVLLGKRSDNHLWGYSGGASDILPPPIHSDRGGGFSLKCSYKHSVNELSPCTPRF